MIDEDMNPGEFEYNGQKYLASYDYDPKGVVSFVQIQDAKGKIIAEADHEGETYIGDLLDILADAGEMKTAEEIMGEAVSMSPAFNQVNENAEMERKLDEILKVLKKIEKNTRK